MSKILIHHIALNPFLIDKKHTEVEGLLLPDLDDENIDELISRLHGLNYIPVMLREDKTTVRLD